jgi:hypothetical protein
MMTHDDAHGQMHVATHNATHQNIARSHLCIHMTAFYYFFQPASLVPLLVVCNFRFFSAS